MPENDAPGFPSPDEDKQAHTDPNLSAGETGSATGPAPVGTEPNPGHATPMMRIWAMVGVVYMVIIVLLVTFGMATGRYLTGIGGLMILPALGGAAVSLVWMWHSAPERRTPLRAALLVLLLALCAVMAVLGLLDGIPALISNFGG